MQVTFCLFPVCGECLIYGSGRVFVAHRSTYRWPRYSKVRCCQTRGAPHWSENLINFMLFQPDWCMFIRLLSAMDVSPTYCLLQTLHVIRCIAFTVFHVWRPFMAEMAPDLALNVCAMVISLHGLDSHVGLPCLGVTFALTMMSLRLFRRLNATIGFSGKIQFSFEFVLMICQCLYVLYFWEILVVRSTKDPPVRCLCHTIYKSMSLNWILGFKFRCIFGWS